MTIRKCVNGCITFDDRSYSFGSCPYCNNEIVKKTRHMKKFYPLKEVIEDEEKAEQTAAVE